MKKIIFAVVALSAFSLNGASAQENAKNGQNREEMRKAMVSKQAERLVEEMKLDDSKAADFKKLFEEYKNKEIELAFAGRKEKRGSDKAGKQEKGRRAAMTDAKADSLMNASFEKQEKELQLRKEYYAKFKAQVGAANAYKVVMPRPQMMPGMNNRANGRGGFGGGPEGRPGGNFGAPGGMGGDF